MAEVPEDLGAGGDGGVQHGEEAGPVVLAGGAGFDEVPAEAVADRFYAGFSQEGIVPSGVGGVAGGGEDVDLEAVPAFMGGAFKAAHEEAREAVWHGVVRCRLWRGSSPPPPVSIQSLHSITVRG